MLLHFKCLIINILVTACPDILETLSDTSHHQHAWDWLAGINHRWINIEKKKSIFLACIMQVVPEIIEKHCPFLTKIAKYFPSFFHGKIFTFTSVMYAPSVSFPLSSQNYIIHPHPILSKIHQSFTTTCTKNIKMNQIFDMKYTNILVLWWNKRKIELSMYI